MKTHRLIVILCCIAFHSARAQLNTWVTQNPSNLAGTYRSVQAITEMTAVMVGDKGLVTMTSDAGTTLTNRQVGTLTLNGVSFIDTLTGMVVGANGTAYKTTDGGKTWATLSTGVTDPLLDVLMVDNQLALICGGNSAAGTLLISRDGGSTWNRFPQELSFGAIRRLRMPRPGLIVFVGDGGMYYASRDSARTFESFRMPSGNTINDVYYLDDRHAIAVGGPGRYILGTNDAGHSWQFEDSMNFTLGAQPLNSVDKKGNGPMIAVGDHGELLYSSNSGSSWSRSEFGSMTSIKRVSMLSEYSGIAVGQDGVVIKTTDGGTSWTFIPRRPQTSALRTIRMMNDGRRGFAAGSYGAILTTVDSGHTWLPVQTGTTSTFYGSALDDRGNGFVVGEFGTIFGTTDAGTTWTRIPSNTTRHLRAVSFASRNAVYAVGDSALFLRSTDGGQYWTRYHGPLPDTVGITSLAFFDSSYGFITSPNGVFRTSDAGISWKKLNIPDTYVFSTIGIGAARSRLYLGGLGGLGVPPLQQQWHGALAYSSDGGDTWKYTDITEYSTLAPLGIYTADGYHATVVGHGAMIIHTVDPDSSWHPQRALTTADLFSVTFGTTHAGWTCGFRGTILRIDTDEEADVKNPTAATVSTLQIERIYPNPAVNRIRMQYTLSQSAPTYVELYDMRGTRVAMFDLGLQTEGQHVEELNFGSISSGTYVLTLSSGGAAATTTVSVIH
ncbi:MAG: T9SS type A sorting domain-containing protein [Bacteroidetes bacterium]|nr:T9SS type A sorting domain-containing protein [Bacteroidota bacterium]